MKICYFNVDMQSVANEQPVGSARWLRVCEYPSKHPIARLVFVVGKTEFGEKYKTFSRRLNSLGIDLLTIEPRGQGGSSRFSKNRRSGHVPDHNLS